MKKGGNYAYFVQLRFGDVPGVFALDCLLANHKTKEENELFDRASLERGHHGYLALDFWSEENASSQTAE